MHEYLRDSSQWTWGKGKEGSTKTGVKGLDQELHSCPCRTQLCRQNCADDNMLRSTRPQLPAGDTGAEHDCTHCCGVDSHSLLRSHIGPILEVVVLQIQIQVGEKISSA
jgi:hypothetical protein